MKRSSGLARALLRAHCLFNGASIALIACACAVGCVDSAEPRGRPQHLDKHLVSKVPEQAKKLDIKFGDHFTLVAAEVTPEQGLKRGSRVNVKMYWRVDKELTDPGWKLFTHVNDGAGERIMNIDNVGPLRRFRNNNQTWPPSNWKTGEIYVDTQSFTVPRKLKTKQLQIVTGIWKGRSRQKITSGPTAGDDRGLVATLDIQQGKRRADVPSLQVPQLTAGKQLKLDGKLDDEAWLSAATTGPFVDVRTGKPAKGSKVQGSAKLLWDADHLYVGFDVEDSDIQGGFKPDAKDPHLWTKDCVEIMIDPDGNGDNKDYYEIQVGPQNLVFDSRFDSYNTPVKRPDGPFGHQDWSAQLKSAVTVNGTIDNDKDKDKGYSVEIQIPWSAFNKAKQSPPKPKQSWRVNLYAMENNGGVAWSPILGEGNFHKASRFGRLQWVEKVSETKDDKLAANTDGKANDTNEPKPSIANVPRSMPKRIQVQQNALEAAKKAVQEKQK